MLNLLEVSADFLFGFSLEQLYLNKNCLNCIFYPDNGRQHESLNNYTSEVTCYEPFQKLHCLLLGNDKYSYDT